MGIIETVQDIKQQIPKDKQNYRQKNDFYDKQNKAIHFGASYN